MTDNELEAHTGKLVAGTIVAVVLIIAAGISGAVRCDYRHACGDLTAEQCVAECRPNAVAECSVQRCRCDVAEGPKP